MTNNIPFKDWQERLDNPTRKDKIMNVWYDATRWIRNIRYWPKEIKWAYQRVRYGISQKDAWGLDSHLASIIVRGATQLKKYKRGVPCELMGVGVTEEQAHVKWEAILENIIYTFQTHIAILNMDVIMDTDKERVKELQESENFKDTHFMTDEEIERFENGWKLFKEFFGNLWD